MELFNLATLILIVELAVLVFLIWHIKELNETSNDLRQVIKEMDRNHKEMHKDTRIVRDAVHRLELDMRKVHRHLKEKKK